MGRRLPRAALEEVRAKLAEESARLMIEHGIRDYRLAKRKAADRLAVSGLAALPSNTQIEACLLERQRLFQPDVHASHLKHLRGLAYELMQALWDFEPRLAGPVLSGTATVTSGIELHLFAVGAEAVAAQLADMGLTASTYERRMRFGGGRSELVPGFKLNYSGERTILLVFPEHGVREAPLSQVDRRPLQRASLRKLARLIDAD